MLSLCDCKIIDAALESGRVDIVKYCLALDSKCDVQYDLNSENLGADIIILNYVLNHKQNV